MSREIKFRAWDKKQQRMIGETSINMLAGLDNDHGPSYYEQNVVFLQYTGLKDDQGKDVYEGDIVTVTIMDVVKKERCRGEVRYIAPMFCIVTPEYVLPLVPGEFCDVVGNIYESPEKICSTEK